MNQSIKQSILFLAVIAVIGYFSCRQTPEVKVEHTVESAPAVIKTVEVTKALSTSYNNEVYAVGRLSSKAESKLSFKTGGLIKNINVQEGQSVSSGSVLAQLDMEEINAQVQKAQVGESQAALTLKNAELQVAKFERDYADIKALYEDQVATLTELKDIKTLLDNARNQVAAARSGLDFSKENQKIANYNQRLSKITAPGNGVILKRLAEPNEIVGPGMPVFIFGSKDDAMVLKSSVTDKEIVHIKIGNKADVSFDAFPDRTFEGRVTEVAGIADPYTGTYEVEVALNPSNVQLLSGFIGEATIYSSYAPRVKTIPMDAMISANGNAAEVYVVQDGIIESRTLKVGPIQGDQLIIYDGLKEGDLIVTRGASYVAVSDAVKVEMR